MKLHLIASMLTLAAAIAAQQSPEPQQPPQPQGQQGQQGQTPPPAQQPKVEAGDGGYVPPGQEPGAQAPAPSADQLEKEKALRPPTQEERIAKLKEQAAKLEHERTYLQSIQQQGGVVGRIRSYLENRGVVADSFTDKSAPVGPMPAMGAAQPKPAKKVRLLGDAEKAKLDENAIFTVDGMAVARPEFDELMTYLKSYPRDENEDQLKQLAILQLIKVKAGEAMLAETARKARGRIAEAQQKITDGADFAAVAKEMSDCPSKASGGDLGFFGRESMDLSFTRAAYGLKPGEVSDIVPSTYGYHLIKVTGVKKGDTPEQDQVQASHILVLYHPDQGRVMEAQSKVSTGEVDVAFRSDDLRKHAPEFLK